MNDALFITHMGAATPIGTRIGQSAAMYHAGISRYASHPNLPDRGHQPLPFCHAQYLDENLMIVERLAFLMIRVLQGDFPT